MAFTDWSITMGPQEGVDELNGRFDKTVGHEHDGTAGGGKKINVASIALETGNAKGDILYTTAAGILTKLAIGSEGQHLLVSSDGLPAYGATSKFDSFTRDLSVAAGTQSITGVGFKPSKVIFISGMNGAFAGVGIDDGTKHGLAGAGSVPVVSGTYSILVSDASFANSQQAYISSLDSDGFTLTWAKTGTPTSTQTVLYLALR